MRPPTNQGTRKQPHDKTPKQAPQADRNDLTIPPPEGDNHANAGSAKKIQAR